MVEIGGEVRAKGKNSDQKTWTIVIDKPIESGERELIAKVELDNSSIATSGNYRKFKTVNGEKVGHILNPKSGFMKRTNVLSVSVISTDCYRADAMATAFMSMNAEEIKNMDESQNDLGVIVIYKQDQDTLTYISNKYKGKIKP